MGWRETSFVLVMPSVKKIERMIEKIEALRERHPRNGKHAQTLSKRIQNHMQTIIDRQEWIRDALAKTQARIGEFYVPERVEDALDHSVFAEAQSKRPRSSEARSSVQSE